MRNHIRIQCPNCDTTMKCGTNAQILEGNRDGIALCLACGFRAGLVVVYDVMASAPNIRIPPSVPPGQTVAAPTVFCPVCRERAKVRTSQMISGSLKWMRVYCLDESCGYRVNAYLELTEQLTVLIGMKDTGIPYRAGLLDAARRELKYSNTLPRLIHERRGKRVARPTGSR